MGRRLGQHFLTNPRVAGRLVEGAHITGVDTVLEIGPGTGALTREILATGAHVIAVEKDNTLVTRLKETFAKEVILGKLNIIAGDVRDYSPESLGLMLGQYVLAANIPYYITGEIIRKFLTAGAQPRTMALLVQKEVAERIVARNGKESILSLSVKAYGTPRVVAKVSRGNFSPPPSVDSAILTIENISRSFFSNIDEIHFFRIIKAGFASKRKFLARNLALGFGLETVRDAFSALKIPENVRAEDVSLVTWKHLAKQLTENSEQ